MGKKPRNLLKEDVVPTIFKHSQGPSRKSVSLFETERESERERERERERARARERARERESERERERERERGNSKPRNS